MLLAFLLCSLECVAYSLHKLLAGMLIWRRLWTERAMQTVRAPTTEMGTATETGTGIGNATVAAAAIVQSLQGGRVLDPRRGDAITGRGRERQNQAAGLPSALPECVRGFYSARDASLIVFCHSRVSRVL